MELPDKRQGRRNEQCQTEEDRFSVVCNAYGQQIVDGIFQEMTDRLTVGKIANQIDIFKQKAIIDYKSLNRNFL